jgi:hypothetical protein
MVLIYPENLSRFLFKYKKKRVGGIVESVIFYSAVGNKV